MDARRLARRALAALVIAVIAPAAAPAQDVPDPGSEKSRILDR